MVIIKPVVIIVPEEVIIVPLSALKLILHIYFNKTQLVLFPFYRNEVKNVKSVILRWPSPCPWVFTNLDL